MVLSAPMVYPRDYVARTGALWLATHAQHHERKTSNTYCLLQKTKKAKLRIRDAVSTEHILLLHHREEEKIVNYQKSGLLCIS